ncbi:MAG TPA: histidine phosphatase family protein [Azoarcus taiwanensis]|nr:histidine phosphatase family protein [Azoarcus taiwanensis]
MTTTLCLVRHGETPWNADRRLQGHLDVPLNDHGRIQARATGAMLNGKHFDAVYSSDLARALETARSIAGDTAPTILPALRERHYGSLQGLTYEEARQRLPEAYAAFEARNPSYAFPGGGETLLAFRSRVESTLHLLAQRHVGQQVLVVTHGGVLDIVHRLVTGKSLESPRDFKIPNAALNWVEHGPEGWALIAWAETMHLPASRDELPNS